MATPDAFALSWIRSQRSRAQQSAIAVAEAEKGVEKLQIAPSSSTSAHLPSPATTPVGDVAHDEFVSSLPAAFVQGVYDLRTKYATIVNEYATRITNRQPVEDLESLYKPAADLLLAAYTLCQQHIKRLGLHVLFISPTVQTEVEAMLRLLFRDALITEAAFVAEQTDGFVLPCALGSRTLLTGVRGIGKTTILRVVQISVALLSKYMVPVYVNYEEEKKQGSIQRFSAYVMDCAEAAGFDTSRMRAAPNNISVAMDSLRAQGAVLSALVDEMQVLYEEQFAVVGGFAAAEILSIARRSFENAIVSGSSHSLADLAFKRISQPWNKDFVDLNNTVYVEERLHPLSRATFDQVAPLLGFRAASLDVLYSLTGGVGRDMDKALRRGVPQDPAPWFKRFDEEYDKNGLFAHAIAYMDDHSVEEIGVGSLRAIHKTMTGNEAGADAAISKVVDAGILCPVSSNASNYRLLLPGAFAHIISRNGIRAGLSEKAILAFRSVLNYWEGAGSPGGFCESFVRQWMCDKWPDLGPARSMYLHMQDSSKRNPKPEASMHEGKVASSTNLGTISDLRLIVGMYGLAKETGMDGISISKANDSGTKIKVTIIQLKLGAINTVNGITAGARYKGEHVDNSTQAKAMVGSAVVGFNRLLANLFNSTGQPINYITAVTYWLVTNKPVNAEATHLLLDDNSPAAAYFQANCNLSGCTFSTDLLSGEDFRSVVPATARSIIAVNGF